MFKKIIIKIKENLISFILAYAIFFNLAHFAFNFWEQPAWIMILAFVVSVPLLTWLMIFPFMDGQHPILL